VSEADLLKLIDEADESVDADRQGYLKTVAKCEAYYDGTKEKYIKPWEAERAEEFKDRPKPPSNVTRRVVNTFFGALYGKEPKRFFPEGSNDHLYQKILRANEGFMSDGMLWHRHAELSGCSAVIPRFSARRQSFYVDVYSGDQIMVLPDAGDAKHPRAIVISFRVPDRQKKEGFAVYNEVWTEDEFLATLDGKVMEDDDGRVVGFHEYGEIPIALFQTDPVSNYQAPRPACFDVVEMNQQIEQMLSSWAEVIRYQSFNVYLYKQPNEATVTASPKKWLATNNPDADIKLVAPAADTRILIDSIMEYFEMIADIGEVPAFSLHGGAKTAESGVALAIKFQPHAQAVDRRKVFFKGGEIRLARNLLRTARIQAGIRIDESEEAMSPTVDFEEQSIPMSVDEQIAWNAHRINLGLTSAVNLYLERNPEASQEEALKEVQANLEQSQKLRSLSAQGDPDEFARSAADEARRKASEKNPAGADDDDD
jgi:hypothetical protein